MTTAHFPTTTTVRNVTYSFLWALFAWLFFWLFWLGAVPGTATSTRGSVPVFNYVSRSATAAGVTPFSVPFVMPGRIKLLTQGESFQTTDLMTNYSLPPVFLDTVPGGYASEPAAGLQTWASTTSAISVMDGPILFEQSAFQITNGLASGWRVDIADGLTGCQVIVPDGLISVPPVSPRTLAATVWIEVGMWGEVTHAFIESTTGNDAVDREVMKLIYASQIKGARGSAGGRLRVTLQGVVP